MARAWVEPDQGGKNITIEIFQGGVFHPWATIEIPPLPWHIEHGLSDAEMRKIEVDTQ